MRDLSGIDWQSLFGGALDWRVPTRVGASAGSCIQYGSSQDILPYRGNVTFSFNSKNNINTQGNSDSMTTLSEETHLSGHAYRSNLSPYISEYCKPFNYFSPIDRVSTDTKGISVAALLKNGKWDELYRNSHVMGAMSLCLNIEELQLHYDESEYARGTSGGLRYRLTQCIGGFDNLYGYEDHSYTVRYFTRDYTPQKPKIKFSKIYSEYIPSDNTLSLQSDDYFIDVVIGIRNLEGTKRVVVKQLDEGESLPFEYEILDFRKGFFVANLDRELSTQLYVTYYNDNGSTSSEPINIAPQGYNDVRVIFKRSGNSILIKGLPDIILESDKLTCSLIRTDDGHGRFQFVNITDGAIDISTLPRGNYFLTINYRYDTLGTYSFRKTN